MGNLAGFFANMAVTLPARVLTSIGIGFVSFAGYSVVVNGLISSFSGVWNNIPSDLLSYITLAGFTTGLGLILGSFVMRLSLTALTNLGKVT